MKFWSATKQQPIKFYRRKVDGVTGEISSTPANHT
ncbi:hypothetical protein T03_8623, partial [Trichinella britovi]